MTPRVFVYGTLKTDGGGHRLVESWVTGVARGTVTGFRLFECGAYPAVWPSPRRAVRGEVLTLSDPAAALARLDEYEECPEEYRRDEVQVDVDGGSVRAWIYVLAEEPRGIWRPVPGEVWLPAYRG